MNNKKKRNNHNIGQDELQNISIKDIKDEYDSTVKKVKANGLDDSDVRGIIESIEKVVRKSTKTLFDVSEIIDNTKESGKEIDTDHRFYPLFVTNYPNLVDRFNMSLKKEYKTGTELLNACIQKKQNESDPDINADIERILEQKKQSENSIEELIKEVSKEIEPVDAKEREKQTAEKIPLLRGEIFDLILQTSSVGAYNAFMENLQNDYHKITAKVARFHKEVIEEQGGKASESQGTKDRIFYSNEYLCSAYLYIHNVLDYYGKKRKQTGDFLVFKDKYLCALWDEEKKWVKKATDVVNEQLALKHKKQFDKDMNEKLKEIHEKKEPDEENVMNPIEENEMELVDEEVQMPKVEDAIHDFRGRIYDLLYQIEVKGWKDVFVESLKNDFYDITNKVIKYNNKVNEDEKASEGWKAHPIKQLPEFQRASNVEKTWWNALETIGNEDRKKEIEKLKLEKEDLKNILCNAYRYICVTLDYYDRTRSQVGEFTPFKDKVLCQLSDKEIEWTKKANAIMNKRLGLTKEDKNRGALAAIKEKVCKRIKTRDTHKEPDDKNRD